MIDVVCRITGPRGGRLVCCATLAARPPRGRRAATWRHSARPELASAAPPRCAAASDSYPGLKAGGPYPPGTAPRP
jgi:hypothetical protein